MAHRQHCDNGRGIYDAHLSEAASSERLGREPHSFPEASFTPSTSAAETTVTTQLYTSELFRAMQIAYSSKAPSAEEYQRRIGQPGIIFGSSLN